MQNGYPNTNSTYKKLIYPFPIGIDAILKNHHKTIVPSEITAKDGTIYFGSIMKKFLCLTLTVVGVLAVLSQVMLV